MSRGVRKRKRHDVYTGPPLRISDKRIANLIKAYLEIEWYKNSIEITIPGYGDKPAFAIDGIFKTESFSIPVTFFSNTPGGGIARMYFYKDGKRYIIQRATFNRTALVMEQLLDRYISLKG